MIGIGILVLAIAVLVGFSAWCLWEAEREP